MEIQIWAVFAMQMGAKVVLGDRPVHVTIARLWAALSVFEKTRFIWGMLITGLLPDPKEISETVESLKVSQEMPSKLSLHGNFMVCFN